MNDWAGRALGEVDRWCILRTAGPRTLLLARSLAAAQIEAWTPIEHVRRRIPRGKVVEHRQAPLAPTYVFVRAVHLAEMQALERAEVSLHPRFSIFRFYGETVFVRHAQLHSLHRLQQESYIASLPASGRRAGKLRGEPFSVGDEIKFLGGPFAGFTGFVEASDGLNTEVAVTLFGRAATVKAKTLQLRSPKVSPSASAA